MDFFNPSPSYLRHLSWSTWLWHWWWWWDSSGKYSLDILEFRTRRKLNLFRRNLEELWIKFKISRENIWYQFAFEPRHWQQEACGGHWGGADGSGHRQVNSECQETLDELLDIFVLTEISWMKQQIWSSCRLCCLFQFGLEENILMSVGFTRDTKILRIRSEPWSFVLSRKCIFEIKHLAFS